MRFTIKNLTIIALVIVSLIACWFTANVINPSLHYYLQQTAFVTNASFFRGFTGYPGGIADYISEFVAQFFYYRIFGSVLIVLVAALQGFFILQILQRIAKTEKLNFSIFTLVLLLAVLVQCNYHYPFYAGIRLLMAVKFVWLFTLINTRFPRGRYYSCFFLSALLFYMAGGAALMVFATSVILLQIHLFGRKADLYFLPFFALFTAAIPYLSYKYFFLVNLPLVYSITHSKTPEILYYAPDYKLYALYAFLPISLIIAMIYKGLKRKSGKIGIEPKKEKSLEKKGGKRNQTKPENKTALNAPAAKGESRLSPVFWVTGQLTLIMVLSVILIHFTFDKTNKNKLLVSFYAANAEWDQVIKTAKSIGEYDIFTNLEYNRALANTGKLADNLFSYTQLAGPAGLFLDNKVTSDIPFICCDQYYELGFMHEAQHWAFEAQTIFPNSPRLLKRLVQTNLVLGKYELAEKFLHQLKDNMLYRDWVAHYESYLEDTTLVSKDPDLSWKRKCEPTDNFTAPNAFLKLTKLLQANPGNKMALDYLLCGTLLDGDLATFKTMIGKYPLYARTALPRVFDEGLLLYHYTSRNTPAANELQYSKKSMELFVSFTKAYQPFGKDWRQAGASLKRDYGNTYWYYLKCLNPKVTKAQINRD